MCTRMAALRANWNVGTRVYDGVGDSVLIDPAGGSHPLPWAKHVISNVARHYLKDLFFSGSPVFLDLCLGPIHVR
jgi:hypothetical protein